MQPRWAKLETHESPGSSASERPVRRIWAGATAIAGICTNISNAGAVLGPAVRDWRGTDLVASRGTMAINGEQVGEGLGSDVMGHPLEPLVWLANMLAARGKELKAGATVITGSIIPPKSLKAGDTAMISIGGLGEAHIKVA